MPETPIRTLDDPRLEPFRDLRHKNWIAQSGWFIAEGPLVVERLLSSDYRCHSVLLDDKHYARFRPTIPDDVLILRCSHELVEQVVGFNFHRGVLACGMRKPPVNVAREFAERPAEQGETLVGLHGVQDPENLGGILRTCAALGIKRVLIGPGCADPLSRRSLRVSMGNALKLTLLPSRDLVADLDWLHKEQAIHSLATTLRPDAVPLPKFHRHSPVIVLFGNEKHGLPPELIDTVNTQIRIDMAADVDSLNVGVAAGIILHYLCRLA